MIQNGGRTTDDAELAEQGQFDEAKGRERMEAEKAKDDNDS